MFNNPISALIIGTAMIATALILKPCLEGRKCQCENVPREIICKHECTSNAKQYRYQFIDNQYYWKEKVFDRETGVVYSFGKNEDGGKARKEDFVKGFRHSKEQGDAWLY
jgi:hypothetical protein